MRQLRSNQADQVFLFSRIFFFFLEKRMWGINCICKTFFDSFAACRSNPERSEERSEGGEDEDASASGMSHLAEEGGRCDVTSILSSLQPTGLFDWQSNRGKRRDRGRIPLLTRRRRRSKGFFPFPTSSEFYLYPKQAPYFYECGLKKNSGCRVWPRETQAQFQLRCSPFTSGTETLFP